MNGEIATWMEIDEVVKGFKLWCSKKSCANSHQKSGLTLLHHKGQQI